MGAAAHLGNREWYSELSQLPCFSPARRTDAPERPPCRNRNLSERHKMNAKAAGGCGQRPYLKAAFGARCDGQSTQMVNGRFPAIDRYGFEMVDGRRHPATSHQLKIYAESNRSIFSSNLPDLTSMQTLATYRC